MLHICNICPEVAQFIHNQMNKKFQLQFFKQTKRQENRNSESVLCSVAKIQLVNIVSESLTEHKYMLLQDTIQSTIQYRTKISFDSFTPIFCAQSIEVTSECDTAKSSFCLLFGREALCTSSTTAECSHFCKVCNVHAFR